MNMLIRQICVLAVFFGLIMHIIPEGNVKRIAIVLCTVILMSVCIEAARGFDFESYTLAASRYRDESAALSADSQTLNRELNRLVIEDSCETYIKDKGNTLGIEIDKADVHVQWSMEGIWCPVSAYIYSENSPDDRLISVIEAELGIPRESIHWEIL